MRPESRNTAAAFSTRAARLGLRFSQTNARARRFFGDVRIVNVLRLELAAMTFTTTLTSSTLSRKAAGRAEFYTVSSLERAGINAKSPTWHALAALPSAALATQLYPCISDSSHNVVGDTWRSPYFWMSTSSNQRRQWWHCGIFIAASAVGTAAGTACPIIISWSFTAACVAGVIAN